MSAWVCGSCGARVYGADPVDLDEAIEVHHGMHESEDEEGNGVKSERPTRPGQAVRDTRTGRIGITTTEPMVTKPSIGVMFLGGPYDVRGHIDELTVIRIAEAGPEA